MAARKAKKAAAESARDLPEFEQLGRQLKSEATPSPKTFQVRRQRGGNIEARAQAAIVDFVRAVAPDVLIYAIPNGGLRLKAEAARMKWTGTLAGIPDLAVIAPGGRAYFIEVKAAAGRLSGAQEEIINRLMTLGAPFALARSIDDVRDAFKRWGIPTRESIVST